MPSMCVSPYPAYISTKSDMYSILAMGRNVDAAGNFRYIFNADIDV